MISRTKTENLNRLRYGKVWLLIECYLYFYKSHDEKWSCFDISGRTHRNEIEKNMRYICGKQQKKARQGKSCTGFYKGSYIIFCDVSNHVAREELW